jgi:hypothetical protein
MEKTKNTNTDSLTASAKVMFLKKHRFTELPPSSTYQMRRAEEERPERREVFGRNEDVQRYERLSQGHITGEATNTKLCESQHLKHSPHPALLSNSSAPNFITE